MFFRVPGEENPLPAKLRWGQGRDPSPVFVPIIISYQMLSIALFGEKQVVYYTISDMLFYCI